MKKFLAMFLAITTLVLSLGAFMVSAEVVTYDCVAPGNQIENGDLSDVQKMGTLYFKNTSGTQNDAHTGEKSLIISGSGKCCAGVPVTLERGKTYVYSAWVKFVSDNDGGRGYNTYPDGLTGGVYTSTRSGSYTTAVNATEWTQIVDTWTINADAPNETYTMTIGLLFNGAVTMLIDDMYFGELTQEIGISAYSSDKGSQTLSPTFTKDALNINVTGSTKYSGYDDPLVTFAYVNQVGTTEGCSGNLASDWDRIDWTSTAGASGCAFGSINTTTASKIRLAFSQSAGSTNKKYRPVETLTATVYKDNTKAEVESSKTFTVNVKYQDLVVSGVSLSTGSHTPSYTLKDVNHFHAGTVMIVTVLYNGNAVEDIVISTGSNELGWGGDATFEATTITAQDTIDITDATNRTIKTFVWEQGDGTEVPVYSLIPAYAANIIG